MMDSFVDTVLELGIITQEQLDEAITHQWEEGGDLEETLVKLGYFNEDSLLTLLSRKYHYHVLDLSKEKIDPEAVKLVPAWLARRFSLIPVRTSDTAMAVAMANPLDKEANSNLQKVVYHDVLPFVAKKADIERLVLEHYGPGLPEKEMAEVTTGLGVTLEIPPLLKKYTFDNFVTGKSNDFAYSVALSAARSYSDEGNPLFLYSDVGMGKTHLLIAIWNYVIEHEQPRKVLFYSSDRFIAELKRVVEEKRMDDFREQYRKIDILLIDDIGFIAGDEVAQQQFFHIFNDLFQGSKQIVVTSDSPPKELATLSKRLRSRFEGGLIIKIDPPNLETRVAILKSKAKNAKIPEDIISLIAKRVSTSVRELEGVLKEALAYSRYKKKPLTEGKIEDILLRRSTLRPYTE